MMGSPLMGSTMVSNAAVLFHSPHTRFLTQCDSSFDTVSGSTESEGAKEVECRYSTWVTTFSAKTEQLGRCILPAPTTTTFN